MRLQNLNSNILFQNNQTIRKLDDATLAQLNRSVDTPEDDVIVKDANGQTQILSVDEYVQNQASGALQGQEALLSVTRHGKNIVVEIGSLSRDALVEALEQINTRYTPSEVENLTRLSQAARPIIDRILNPNATQQVTSLASGESQRLLQQLTPLSNEVTQLREQVTQETSLKADLLGLRSRLNAAQNASGPVTVRTANGLQQLPKQQAITELQRQVSQAQDQLATLPDDLEQRLETATARLAQDLPDLSPLFDDMARINSQIQRLENSTVLNSVLNAIDIAQANGEDSVELNGQRLSLTEARQILDDLPQFVQVQSLVADLKQQTQSLNQLLGNLPEDKLTQVFERYQTQLTQAHEETGVSARLWAAFQSKGGFEIYENLKDIPLPAIPTTGDNTQFAKDITHNTLGYIATASDVLDLAKYPPIAKVLAKLPAAAAAEALTFLNSVVANIPPENTRTFLQVLGPRIADFLDEGARVLGIATDAYGTAYYGGIASGLIYPNVEIDGSMFEIRPSVQTKAVAAAATAFNGLSTYLSAYRLGNPGVDALLGIADLLIETATEYSLLLDQEKLTDVKHKILDAETGPELLQGLEDLRDEYGGETRSLSGIQDVLGQVQVDELTGDIAQVNHNSGRLIDRDLNGRVLLKLVSAAKNNQIPSADARQAIAEILEGVDARWLSDDDVAQSFLNQILAEFPHPSDAEDAFRLLGTDIRQQLFDILNSGVTSNLDWFTEGSTDRSEIDLLRVLAQAESDPAIKGNMVGKLLNDITADRLMGGGFDLASADGKSRLAFDLIADVRGLGSTLSSSRKDDFETLLANIKVDGEANLNVLAYGLQAEEAGTVLAWLVQGGYDQSTIDSYIQNISSLTADNWSAHIAPDNWFSSDDITEAFLHEIDRLGVAPQELQQLINQDMIWTLFNNIEDGYTNANDYKLLARLSKAADTDTRIKMMEELMSGITDSDAERALEIVFEQASPAEKQVIFDRINLKDLGSELESPLAASGVMQRLVQLFPDVDNFNTKINEFFEGVRSQGTVYNDTDDDTAFLFADSFGKAILDRFDDNLLGQLFDSLDAGYTTEAEYALMRRLAESASPDEKARMIQALLDGDTSQAEEDLIYYILKDTPYTDGAFSAVMEKLDPTRLADEISNNGDAARIAGWMAEAESRGGSAGKAAEFLAELSRQHRDSAVSAAIDQLKEDGNLGQLSGAELLTLANNFFAGDTNEAEEDVVVKLLSEISDSQFASLVSEGGNSLLEAIGNELDYGDFTNVLSRLTDLDNKDSLAHFYDHLSSEYSGSIDTIAYNYLNEISWDQLHTVPQEMLHKMHGHLDAGWTTDNEYTAMGWLEDARNW